MRNFILIILAVIVTLLTVVNFSQKRKSGISGGSSTVAPTQSASPSSTTTDSVPLPRGDDVIRTFIQLINEQKIPEAISMMDSNLITSDSVKQQYGVVFNSFFSIQITKIALESFGKEDWGPDEERYRVDLQIIKKPQSQENLWDEGVNTRWVTVKKQGGRFMIHDIATGP